MHCLAEDVHPLLARPTRQSKAGQSRDGTPPSPDRVAVAVEVVWWASLLRSAHNRHSSADWPEKVGHQRQHQPSQRPIRPDQTHVHVLYCGKVHFAGRCCLVARICFIFRRMAEGGVCCRRVQIAGSCNWQTEHAGAALSLAIKHTLSKTQNCTNSQTARKLHNRTYSQ